MTRNTVVRVKDKQGFKYGSIDTMSLNVRILSEKYKKSIIANGNFKDSVTEKKFAVVKSKDVSKFNKGYNKVAIGGTDLYLIVDGDVRIVSAIIGFLKKECIPITQYECVSIHKGVITIIDNNGKLLRFKQQGLKDKDKVREYIMAGLVDAIVLHLSEIPNYVDLVSENESCMQLTRRFNGGK